MTQVKLTIDGIEIEANEDATVLEAARRAGIYIPNLCADPDLEPYGACRLCLVEVDGVEDLPASCMLSVADGMVVRTDTERVNRVRRHVLELLLSDHPSDCLLCAKNQRCELQKVVAYLNVHQPRYKKLEREPLVDSSNPFFTLDSEKCILCGKCVRVCKEVHGLGALEIFHDGRFSKVMTSGEDRLIVDSKCESCGQCMEICPTGALLPKRLEWPAREVKTTCPYCGVGCGMILQVREDRIVGVKGDKSSEVNRGRLCVKGRFGYDFLYSPDRLKTPLIRENGDFREASWDEALDLVAGRFKKIIARHGPDAIAGVSCARAFNEDSYNMQKLFRGVIGTNSIDNSART